MSLPITSLDLSNKNLTKFPSYEECKSLTHLNLSNNPIKEVPTWIKDLPDLKGLDLSGTQISSLPTEINNCPGLKVILFNCPKLVVRNLKDIKITVVRG